MNITTLVPPASEPVALAAAKAFLRIDYDGEDTQVSSLIASARARVEIETGLCLVERTVKITLENWPQNDMSTRQFKLPIGPVIGLESVVIAGVDETAHFSLRKGRPDFLKYNGAAMPPANKETEITLKVGFGPNESYTPADLKLAVKLLVAESYARSGDRGDLTTDVAVLLAPWRRFCL